MANSIVPPPDADGLIRAGESGQLVYFTRCATPGAYATVSDLDDISIPENAQADFTTTNKERWLRIAARRLDAIWGQRWQAPLKAWSDGVIWANCELAFVGLIGKRGHDPEAKTEQTFEHREKTVIAWAEAARDYEITIDPSLVGAEPAKVAHMRSQPQRGWNGCDGHLLGMLSRRGRFF